MPVYLQASTADSAAPARSHPLSSHHHDQQPHLCGAARWEVDHNRGEKSFRDSMKRLADELDRCSETACNKAPTIHLFIISFITV